MKKIYLFLTCCFIFSVFQISAQYDGYRKPVKIGFDAAMGFANQWGDAYDAYGKTGLFCGAVGIDVDINFKERSFIEIGTNFKRKGCRIEGHEWIDNVISNGGPFELRTKDKTVANLLYIQIPILYGVELPIENNVAWKFMVGPYFSIGVAGDRRNTFKHIYEGRLETVSSFSDDHDYGYRRFDFGSKISTGIEVGKVSYLVSYELGLVNTIKQGREWDTDVRGDFDYKARNNGILFIISFRF